jgi:hypothetical protein
LTSFLIIDDHPLFRKAHLTEILRKLKLFSRDKAMIEIGKIDLPAPKQQASMLERAKPT